MDTHQQLLLCLTYLFCFNPVLSTEAYCSGLYKTPATSVCQNSTATGTTVYLDSTGAPLGQEVSCNCYLTASVPLSVDISYTTERSSHGIQFKVSGFTFQDDTSGEKRIDLNHNTKLEIIFTKTTTERNASAGCLAFEINDSGNEPPSRSITITCYPEQKYDHEDQTANNKTAIIAGAVGGGCFILIVFVVIIAVFQRRKHRQDHATISEVHINKTVNEAEHYVVKVDIKAEQEHPKINNESAIPAIRRKASGAYTEINDVVEEPNPIHVYNTTTGSEYNHIHGVNSRHNTDNVYNKLNEG